jgi:hypothetical protein
LKVIGWTALSQELGAVVAIGPLVLVGDAFNSGFDSRVQQLSMTSSRWQNIALAFWADGVAAITEGVFQDCITEGLSWRQASSKLRAPVRNWYGTEAQGDEVMHVLGAFELDIQPGTPNNPASVRVALLRYVRGEDGRLFGTPESTYFEEV